MDDEAHYQLLQQLGDAMSAISERCWFAGWLAGTEYLVPELCRRSAASGSAQPWGRGEVTPGEALQLLELAACLGTWADLGDHQEFIPHQPFPVPPEHAEALDRELMRRVQSAGSPPAPKESTSGASCPRCGVLIPVLPPLPEQEQQRIAALLAEGRMVETIKVLVELTGWDSTTAKTFVHHEHEPLAPCPFCGAPLRTPRARQCRACGRKWHHTPHGAA